VFAEATSVRRQNARRHLQRHTSKRQESDLGHRPSCFIRKHAPPRVVDLTKLKLCRGCQQSLFKSFVCHTFSIFCFRVPFRDTLTSFRRYNPPVDPNQHLGRTLMLLGAVLVVAGTLLYFGGRLPFRLGRLPGDIVHRGDHSTLYFPFTTCILLSVALSLIFWLVNHFRR